MKIFTKRKRFCYCLQAFSTEEILECHIKDIFKIAKKELQWLKKCEYVKLKNYERKIKWPFTIYTDFHRVLVPEDKERKEKSRTLIQTNTNLLFVVKPALPHPLDLETVQGPFCRQFALYIFVNPLKIDFFLNSKNIKFFILHSILSFKSN